MKIIIYSGYKSKNHAFIFILYLNFIFDSFRFYILPQIQYVSLVLEIWLDAARILQKCRLKIKELCLINQINNGYNSKSKLQKICLSIEPTAVLIYQYFF